MLKKSLCVFLVIILVLSAFAGCSKAGSDARLVLPVDNEPEFLDPQIISDSGSCMIMANCMEGLLEYNSEGALTEAACESYNVSADGCTYTFNLRQDGKWRVTTVAGAVLGEDYKETFDTRVTAKDFVFALRRALQPETLCPYAGLFMNIKNAEQVYNGSMPSDKLGVYAKDDYVLEIKLEKEDCDFLSALTTPAAYPCNEIYFTKTGGRYGLSVNYMIFNGPFYLSNWAEETAITIRRNNSYHSLDDNAEKEIMPASVYFSFNKEISSRSRKLKDETYHLTPLTDFQVQEVADSKKIQMNTFESTNLSLVFNCGAEYTSSSNLRRALAYGLDYSVLKTFGERPKSVIPGGLTVAGEKAEDEIQCKLPKSDRQKAGKLYTKALDELELQKIELTILCDEQDETLVRTLIQNWQSVFGVIFTVSVEPCDTLTLRTRIESGDYQLALYRPGFSGDIARNALNSFTTGGRNNICNFSDEIFDNLVMDCYRVGSEKAVVANLIDAQNYLIDNGVIIPLLKSNLNCGVYSKCNNLAFSPSGQTVYFKNALCR